MQADNDNQPYLNAGVVAGTAEALAALLQLADLDMHEGMHRHPLRAVSLPHARTHLLSCPCAQCTPTITTTTTPKLHRCMHAHQHRPALPFIGVVNAALRFPSHGVCTVPCVLSIEPRVHVDDQAVFTALWLSTQTVVKIELDYNNAISRSSNWQSGQCKFYLQSKLHSSTEPLVVPQSQSRDRVNQRAADYEAVCSTENNACSLVFHFNGEHWQCQVRHGTRTRVPAVYVIQSCARAEFARLQHCKVDAKHLYTCAALHTRCIVHCQCPYIWLVD